MPLLAAPRRYERRSCGDISRTHLVIGSHPFCGEVRVTLFEGPARLRATRMTHMLMITDWLDE